MLEAENTNQEGVQTLIPEIGAIPVFGKTVIPMEHWKDGLVVRTPNWLGDAVMAIPAIMQLKKMLPAECGLFVLCPKGIAPVFESLPQIADRVVPLQNPHAFFSWKERQTVIRLQCGAGVLFNNSFRDALSLRLAGVRPLFGSDARFRRLLLKKAYSFPPRLDHRWNKPHQAAKYLSIAYALGAPQWDGSLPEFHLNPNCFSDTDELKTAFAMKKVLCVAAGAAYGDAKRWPTENFIEAARRWVTEENGSVLLLGSLKEREAAETIREALPQNSSINLAGHTALTDVIRILRQAAVVLANDSGLMHLSAVLGTPGVVPFGPTDPAATSPLSSDWRILCRKIKCSPCFKRECPFGTKVCFEGIDSPLVFETLCKISRKEQQ